MLLEEQIMERVLDPLPFTDDEIEAHVEWAWKRGTQHPLYTHVHPLLMASIHPNIPAEWVKEVPDAYDPFFILREKHKAFSKEATNIFFVERAFRPLALHVGFEAYDLLADDEPARAELIRAVWQDTESGSDPVWVEIMDRYPASQMRYDPDRLLGGKDGTTKVWRGISVVSGSAVDRTGFYFPNYAWTTDRARAEWFARRYASIIGRLHSHMHSRDEKAPSEGDAIVLTGEVANEDVLFATDERGEAEVVSSLVSIQRLERLQ